MWKNSSFLPGTLTSTLLNTFRMNWNTDCTSGLLTNAFVAEWASPHSCAPNFNWKPSQKSLLEAVIKARAMTKSAMMHMVSEWAQMLVIVKRPHTFGRIVYDLSSCFMVILYCVQCLMQLLCTVQFWAAVVENWHHAVSWPAMLLRIIYNSYKWTV